MEGGAVAVARWGTRKYKKHLAYLRWVHLQERRAAGLDQDDEEGDDGTPRWEVVENDGGGDWESESHTRPWS